MDKINVLAKYLEVDETEIKEGYNNNIFEYGNQEYLVVDEEEADQAVKENILESLWAFNIEFVLPHTNIDNNDRVIKALKKMQAELCEDCNEIIKGIITDIEEFIEDAVETDGRGHLLSPYNGEEVEEEGYFIYRLN